MINVVSFPRRCFPQEISRAMAAAARRPAARSAKSSTWTAASTCARF